MCVDKTGKKGKKRFKKAKKSKIFENLGKNVQNLEIFEKGVSLIKWEEPCGCTHHSINAL